jgi:hypothetical protein
MVFLLMIFLLMGDHEENIKFTHFLAVLVAAGVYQMGDE